MASKNKNKTVLFLGVAAVAIAGAVAFFTVTASEPEVSAVEIGGETLPVLVDNQPVGQDAAFGMDAPAVAGSDWNGNPVAIDPSDGRPKVIVFLAHWCPHCQEEVPEVQAWLDRTGSDPDVDIYGVATSINRTRPNWPPGEWLEREGWTPLTVMDNNGRAATAYGLSAFPYWVAVNPDGKVVYRLAANIGTDGLVSLQQLATRTISELEDLTEQEGQSQ